MLAAIRRVSGSSILIIIVIVTGNLIQGFHQVRDRLDSRIRGGRKRGLEDERSIRACRILRGFRLQEGDEGAATLGFDSYIHFGRSRGDYGHGCCPVCYIQ